MRRSGVSTDLLQPKSVSNGGLAQLGRAQALQAWGHGFEPHILHQFVRVIRSGSYDLIAGPTEIRSWFMQYQIFYITDKSMKLIYDLHRNKTFGIVLI